MIILKLIIREKCQLKVFLYGEAERMSSEAKSLYTFIIRSFNWLSYSHLQ